MILPFLSEKGIEYRPVRQGNQREFCSPCPACGGNDRLRTWPDQSDGEGRFWCRQCGIKGDAIQFAVDFLGLSFKAAAARCGREVTDAPAQTYNSPSPPASTPVHSWRPNTLSWPSPLWREKGSIFIDWSFGHLHHNQDHLDYLAGRGIPRSVALQLFLGANVGKDDKDLFRTRESWGLSTETKAGKKKKLWFPRGLVIPVYRDGRLTRIKIRMDNPTEHFKYWGIPGSSGMPMVLGNSTSAFVIVEAELDAAAVYAAAGDMVTAVALGSLAIRPDNALHALLQQSNIILNALDADFTGSNDRAKKQNRYNLAWWDNQYKQNERWPVPAGKDPGEAFEQGVDLRAWILAGLPPYLWPKSEKVPEVAQDPGKNKEITQGTPAPVKINGDVTELITLLIDSGAKLWLRDRGRSLGIFESRIWDHEHPGQARRLRELIYNYGPACTLVCSLKDGVYDANSLRKAAENNQKEASHA